jgi:hypothetical protein
MKTIICITTVAILAFLFISSAPAEDNQQAARAKYAELAAKVRAGDMGIDWKALRVATAIGEVGDLSPADSSAVQNGDAALNEGKFNDVLKTGRKIEDRSIADIDTHYLAWRSLIGLGRADESEKERMLLAVLLQSITDSGDGKSAKTAWFATTIRETYLYKWICTERAVSGTSCVEGGRPLYTMWWR